ncbi:hypothetical protein [Fodinibius saliphilus]|uniref:hypothetical protein n=1 Tax=Fodinibius saliphilus TaxID=1920650 RepID=UPI001107B297|nr:hypothetical protein [Fodinibius saliphilus]
MNKLKEAKKIITFLVIALILAVTNPSKESHKQGIKEKYNSQNPITGALGGGYLTSENTEYRSYGVFSLCKINSGGASFGILGMVFVSDLDI